MITHSLTITHSGLPGVYVGDGAISISHRAWRDENRQNRYSFMLHSPRIRPLIVIDLADEPHKPFSYERAARLAINYILQNPEIKTWADRYRVELEFVYSEIDPTPLEKTIFANL